MAQIHVVNRSRSARQGPASPTTKVLAASLKATRGPTGPHWSRPVSTGPAQDITKRVALEATSPRYDRAAGTLTVRVRLLNESTEPVRRSIVFSAGPVRSELDDATAANPDFRNGPASGWLFETGTGESLQPGESTETRVLAFRLTVLRPFRECKRFLRGLASFSWTASVY